MKAAEPHKNKQAEKAVDSTKALWRESTEPHVIVTGPAAIPSLKHELKLSDEQLKRLKHMLTRGQSS